MQQRNVANTVSVTAIKTPRRYYFFNQSCTDIAFCRLYPYRVEPMIQTADTDYTADYDTDYEKPIKSRCFDQNSLKIAYLTPKNFRRPFFSHLAYPLPQKLNFLYDDRYRRCQLFSPIPIATDTSNNRPDYEYYRCIGTALPLSATLYCTGVGRPDMIYFLHMTSLYSFGSVS